MPQKQRPLGHDQGFEDEPPGAYLRELRVGNLNVVCGVLNLFFTIAVAFFWYVGLLAVDSPWWIPAKLIWILIPPSCIVLFLVTFWQAAVGSKQPSWRSTLSLWLCVFALGGWIALRYVGEIDFAGPGLDLFKNKVRCSVCHAGPNFTGEKFHNGVNIKEDKGREDVTKGPKDRGLYKTPTLRNIGQTGSYMHNGSQKTLMEVVESYDKDGEKNSNLDKEIKALELTDQDKGDLVAFMNALTGEVRPVKAPKSVE